MFNKILDIGRLRLQTIRWHSSLHRFRIVPFSCPHFSQLAIELGRLSLYVTWFSK